MLSRSGQMVRLLREQHRIIRELQAQLLDREAGWVDTGHTDTGIPDDRDSLVAQITALELELQEVHHAHD